LLIDNIKSSLYCIIHTSQHLKVKGLGQIDGMKKNPIFKKITEYKHKIKLDSTGQGFSYVFLKISTIKYWVNFVIIVWFEI